ncbi:MAG TPA: rhodanese-like domain-containing protein [Streptosporangiaceae bacterium]|nr:rhodanese-like domain-containing protein [Streptosporangiaceae bacterium]
MNGNRMPSQVPAAEVPADARLVDVREHSEWTAGHAPGATHIPLGELGARYTEIPPGPVYLICRSGSRSNQAAHALSGAGWETLNVSDGMTGWAAAGRPMTNEAGTPPYVA